MPVTRDGGVVPVIDQLADELTERKQTNLLPFVGKIALTQNEQAVIKALSELAS